MLPVTKKRPAPLPPTNNGSNNKPFSVTIIKNDEVTLTDPVVKQGGSYVVSIAINGSQQYGAVITENGIRKENKKTCITILNGNEAQPPLLIANSHQLALGSRCINKNDLSANMATGECCATVQIRSSNNVFRTISNTSGKTSPSSENTLDSGVCSDDQGGNTPPPLPRRKDDDVVIQSSSSSGHDSDNESNISADSLNDEIIDHDITRVDVLVDDNATTEDVIVEQDIATDVIPEQDITTDVIPEQDVSTEDVIASQDIIIPQDVIVPPVDIVTKDLNTVEEQLDSLPPPIPPKKKNKAKPKPIPVAEVFPTVIIKNKILPAIIITNEITELCSNELIIHDVESETVEPKVPELIPKPPEDVPVDIQTPPKAPKEHPQPLPTVAKEKPKKDSKAKAMSKATKKNLNKMVSFMEEISFQTTKLKTNIKSKQSKPETPNNDHELTFHLNEIDVVGKVENKSTKKGNRKKTENEEVDLDASFAGVRDVSTERSTRTIRSNSGTIRGVKNRVRAGIATFLQESTIIKTFVEREQGTVVIYVTTMGVIRETYMKCQKVRQILRTLLIKFDEKDVYLSKDTQQEIKLRMEVNRIHVPQVFLEGRHLGDADTVEKLNESGELRRILRPYKSSHSMGTCERCGGFRLLPCPVCNGSKKSVHRNYFTCEFVSLKCMHCDEAGLVRCDLCCVTNGVNL